MSPLSATDPWAGVENINATQNVSSGPLNQHVDCRSCQGDFNAIYQ